MPETGILNEAIIEELRGVLGDGFPALFRQQIEHANAYIEDIRAMMAKGDMGQVARCAHALKSSAGQVGLLSVQALAKELEQVSSADAESGGVSSRAMEVYGHLTREHDAAVKSLYHYISAAGAI